MEDILLKRKRRAQMILIFATLFFALAIPPGIWAAMMSLLLFNSGKNAMNILLFSFMASFPFICILSFFSWVFYGYKKYEISIFISLLPLLNIIFSGITFLALVLFY
jgi:hypothetical protein